MCHGSFSVCFTCLIAQFKTFEGPIFPLKGSDVPLERSSTRVHRSSGGPALRHRRLSERCDAVLTGHLSAPCMLGMRLLHHSQLPSHHHQTSRHSRAHGEVTLLVCPSEFPALPVAKFSPRQSILGPRDRTVVFAIWKLWCATRPMVFWCVSPARRACLSNHGLCGYLVRRLRG